MAYETATLIGLCDSRTAPGASQPAARPVIFKPAIAPSSSPRTMPRSNPGRNGPYRQGRHPSGGSREQGPERTLFLGWNRRGPIITFELSRYVAPGSLLTIAADTPELEDEVAALKVATATVGRLPRHRHQQPRARCAGHPRPTTTCSFSATATIWRRNRPTRARCDPAAAAQDRRDAGRTSASSAR
jgi:hypothetical protein